MEKTPKVRLLYVAGWYLVNGLNHACRHWAAFLEDRFEHVDVVGFENFYGGLPAPAAMKLRQGLRALQERPVAITPTRNTGRRIILHDVYAPRPIKLFAKELWRYHLLSRAIDAPYDLAIVGDPENAWLAQKLLRAGIARHLIYQDWDYHAGQPAARLDRLLIDRREKACMRCSDAVITGNSLLGDLRQKQGAKRVFVLPYGVSLDRFATAQQKLPHPPTLLYAGSLSPHWGIDLAIRSMPELRRRLPELRLVIVGMGPALAELQALSSQLGVAGRVDFLGHVPYTSLPQLMARADVGILNSQPSSLFRYYATPVKLVDYMAAGLPVIATRTGYQEIMMNESGGGLLIGYDERDFADAATCLFTDRDLWERCSRAGVAYAEGFDWDVLLERAFQFLVRFMDEHALAAA